MHKRIAVPLCAGSRRRCMGQAHCNSGLCSVGNAAVALGVSVPLVCVDAGSAMPSSIYGSGACTYTPSPKIMEMQAAQCKHEAQTVPWHTSFSSNVLDASASEPLGGQLRSKSMLTCNRVPRGVAHTLRPRSGLIGEATFTNHV